jgi:mono/diheme cytochrome c family protein
MKTPQAASRPVKAAAKSGAIKKAAVSGATETTAVSGRAKTFASAALAAACILFIAGTHTTAQAQRGGAAGNAQNGKALFADKMCSQCHGPMGEGSSIGPKLSPNPPAYADFINQVRMPIDKMPAFDAASVSDAQLADIYAFLQPQGAAAAPAASAAALAPGSATNGQKLFMAYGCFECHGRLGQGAAATGPRLAPHPIAITAVLKELRHPANEMPPYTEKVVPDSEVADIYAYLQSVPDPPKPDSIAILSK